MLACFDFKCFYCKFVLFSVDGFDVNRNIRKWFYKSCRLDQPTLDYLTMISLFGLSFVLFILRLSYGSKFWQTLQNDNPLIYKKAVKVE